MLGGIEIVRLQRDLHPHQPGVEGCAPVAGVEGFLRGIDHPASEQETADLVAVALVGERLDLGGGRAGTGNLA